MSAQSTETKKQPFIAIFHLRCATKGIHSSVKTEKLFKKVDLTVKVTDLRVFFDIISSKIMFKSKNYHF